MQQELYQSDDTRLKIQQKLNEKLSETDDLQDQIEELKHKLKVLEEKEN